MADGTKDQKDQIPADQPLVTEVPPASDTLRHKVDQSEPQQKQSDAGANSNKTFLVLISIVLALGFMMYGAFVAGRQSVENKGIRTFMMRTSGGGVQLSPGQVGNSTRSSNYGYGPGGGMMRGGWDEDTNSSTTTRVNGVVTAVSGDTITVAGGGTTTKVTVTSTTNYSGSSEPAKINDTIIAFGTQSSDGSLMATSIRLSRI